MPHRFCGPPESGNGGWVSGHLAALIAPRGSGYPGAPEDAEKRRAEDGAVAVRLSSPPPLDRELRVERADPVVRVFDRDVLVAQAAPASAPGTDGIPLPFSVAEARQASERFDFGASHPFPTCFVCGPLREDGDGLRIFPGPVEGAAQRTTAAVWRPTESSLELVWAALDCPGCWALGIEETPMVLGTMTARVLEFPDVGDDLVVIGWERGQEGRKHYCGTVLYSGERLLAHAEATWIAIDPTTIRPHHAEAEARA